jgi:hypothetical protein
LRRPPHPPRAWARQRDGGCAVSVAHADASVRRALKRGALGLEARAGFRGRDDDGDANGPAAGDDNGQKAPAPADLRADRFCVPQQHAVDFGARAAGRQRVAAAGCGALGPSFPPICVYQLYKLCLQTISNMNT